MSVEFEPWPKIARLNRDIVVTEKIDGTNAAVLITPEGPAPHTIASVADAEGNVWHVYAQSRTRFITPEQDNYGFAKWVDANAETLVEALGEGRHFGEWWGSGIQRGYGLPKGERRFSLFNTSRWKETLSFRHDHPAVPGLRLVPVLYWGKQSENEIIAALNSLEHDGSVASGRINGFQPAEGIIIWHTAGRTFSKVTLKNDDAPKGPAGHALDNEK